MSNRVTCQPLPWGPNHCHRWVDIPSQSVRDEVLARIEADPSAIERIRDQTPRWLSLLALAFSAGFAAGWLCG